MGRVAGDTQRMGAFWTRYGSLLTRSGPLLRTAFVARVFFLACFCIRFVRIALLMVSGGFQDAAFPAPKNAGRVCRFVGEGYLRRCR